MKVKKPPLQGKNEEQTVIAKRNAEAKRKNSNKKPDCFTLRVRNDG
jgi:hypothetical protein